MPRGAKKRKALKKKQQQQESIRTSTNTNGHNLHEKGHGSQDDRESDDSNLSSPASHGNETNDPSAALVNDTAEEISDLVTQRLGAKNGNAIAVERGTDDKKLIVEKPLISSSQDPCVKKIAPVVDSVSKEVVISEKSEHPETSTHSNFDEKKEYPSPGLEKGNGNGEIASLPGSAGGINRKVESSKVTVSYEEKRLLLTGPPAVRTSWLSCCGLFDAVTGSDR